MSKAFVIALLGAESTGKTKLASALAAALAATPGEPPRRVAVVAEYLREFCDRHRRTPRQEEQPGIAAEQTRRIDAAAQDHDIVVADTSAVMIAVYSDHVFGDTSLYAAALATHSDYDLTLLTALDLPWQADGLQRDGPHVREPVDTAVRSALMRTNLAYSVVSGIGDARLHNALACVQRAMVPPPETDSNKRWQWHCERCGDTACERHALLPKA
jgi:nicotinamide riboside kinase